MIDPSHVVVDAETDRLQQYWLFGIMINKFKSPNSRSIVLKHKVDKNMRAIWGEVDDRNSSSMASELNMSQLLQYISTILLKGSQWEKVPQNKFLLHYDEHLRHWNEHADDPFSDCMKVRLL